MISSFPVMVLMLEIIAKLPPNVVAQCKTVCKEWLDFISTPMFLKAHCDYMRASSDQKLLEAGPRSCKARSLNYKAANYLLATNISIPFNAHPENFLFLATLDGMVCVCLITTWEMFVWNPLTTVFKKLSNSNSQGFYKYNSDAIGFCVNSSFDYSIVHIKRRRGTLAIYVYSMRLSSWRTVRFLKKLAFHHETFNWSPRTLCGDGLYFTVAQYRHFGQKMILRFDVNTMEFSELCFPDVYGYGNLGVLADIKSELHMLVSPGSKEFGNVAGIWVERNDNITAYKRSIVMYGRSEYSQNIQSYYGCYDPLSYPLFFPNGESGWHPNIPRQGVLISEVLNDHDNIDEETEDANRQGSRTTVAMRELLQQFGVDVYIKLETSRLQFCERNQDKIRADLYQGIDCVHAGEVRPNRVGQRIVLPASFIGGPRDMRRRFLDAMTLVQDDGKPDLFFTMTCNPQWPEICDNLKPGQTAQDCPDLVSRVFRAKLEDLKEQLLKKHLLGEVKAYVYVIEFQKRGLPHAHFFLIMYPQDKINNPNHYDKVVCAEIPDVRRHPKLHDLVFKNMMHGPCRNLRPDCPCMQEMQGNPNSCRFRYPRQFNDQTTQGEDAYPLYRRRNNGIMVNVRGEFLDNRWVVPYNPMLLMLFNCHMNLEACSSIKSVKYIFKYVYKGHDKQVIQIDPDEQEVIINEIKRFQDARYVSPPEAMWRIFSFPLSQIVPAVLTLQVHLPNKQMVRFRDDDIMSEVVDRERNKKTMLTAFFETNRLDEMAREYLYKDFPKHFTWNAGSRRWNRRVLKPQRGRLVSANPAEGERYYLRLLLSNVKGPTSFEDLCTVNGVKYPTIRRAALEIGLIENDDCLSQCLTEASLFQFPKALRGLFATILIFCKPGDVRKLWNDHFDSLSEDYRLHCENIHRVQDMVLVDIRGFLQSMGTSINQFDLPKITEDVNLQYAMHREVQDEYRIVVEHEHLSARDSLNFDQKVVYYEIMTHVDNDRPGLFFIDGPGGTGKTFVYKALLAQVRSRGIIALATTSSGAAANNMPGGRTTHSRFKIPINLNNNSMCKINHQSGTAELIRLAKLIIWDEASMAKRQVIEAVDRTLQDIIGVRLPFGGKIMVMGGDFRQVLPVVKRGTRAQIVDSSFRMSPLWSVTKKMRLTINMRALNDSWFSDFLLRVGDGSEEAIEGNLIRIPDDMTIPFTTKENSIKELFNAIFPSIENNVCTSDYIASRAILSTRNESVDDINDQMLDNFQGEENVYYSFDEVEDDKHHFYPIEFLMH
ncbi:uncharacterized protein LOC143579149 [Bidens hawaiensis]|uniref:uncharacterized protein LOC143579149 n=1 Tax=Bidens hawaiensis TaxID=980011 RepID=UPI004049FAB8